MAWQGVTGDSWSLGEEGFANIDAVIVDRLPLGVDDGGELEAVFL